MTANPPRLPVLPTEPYDLPPLPHGVRLRVRPLDTPVYEAARAKATRLIAGIKSQAADAASVGARLEGLPDLSDPDYLEGYRQFIFTVCLAQAAVIGGTSPDETGATVDLGRLDSPDRDAFLASLMRRHNVAEAFIIAYTAEWAALDAEKNASSPAPNGGTAAGGNGAPPVSDESGFAPAKPTRPSVPPVP